VRVFKNKPFARFARKCEISDADLCGAVHAANRGLIDADLGGGVIKQRIARRGSGKSGGFRTLVVFQILDRAIFVHGFAKNDTENIRPDELVALKKLAIDLLGYREADLEASIRSGTLTEVNCDGEYETVSQQSNGVHS
jgi:hypothetical protein